MFDAKQGMFDFEAAAKRRDDALERADNEWSAEFERCALLIAARGRPFTTDDILQAFPKLEQCDEKRCFGAVLMRLARAGTIKALGYRSSGRRQSHARPKREWISNDTEGKQC